MTGPTTEEILAARAVYGDYADKAEMIQSVMRILADAPQWDELSDVHKETVHMIIHKISRAIYGNPMEPDHFDDVAGYAKLLADWIRKQIGLLAGSTVVMATDLKKIVNDKKEPPPPEQRIVGLDLSSNLGLVP